MDIDKPFVDRSHFTCIYGHEFYIGGEVIFPEETRNKVTPEGFTADGTYRTLFGPTHDHNGHIFGNTNLNLRYAMRRLTCIRKPETPQLHDLLLLNQRRFVLANFEEIDSLYFSVCRDNFGDYLGMLEECRLHHADPHPKKQLRQQAYCELLESGMIHQRLWLKNVRYKLKKDEIAKAGKYGRMIGDLGVAASLQGFRLTKFMKEVQTRRFHLFGGIAQFIATPRPSELHRVFDHMRSPEGLFYFAMFSDDSVLAVRDRGAVRWYNLDISGCDSSHGDIIFQSLLHLVPRQHMDDLLRLIEQCALPIVVSSSDNRHKVKLRPKHPTLYSGSTLTTTINNWANFLIIFAIAKIGDFSPQGIVTSARLCGYFLTVDVCETFEDVQFLKNSPVLDTEGVYRPMPNLGILLRSTGVCRGDLPGRKSTPLSERGRLFQASLLQGMYPRIHCTLLDSMKSVAGPYSDALVQKVLDSGLNYKIVHESSYPVFRVNDDDLYRRYRLTPHEIAELNSVLGTATFGDHVSTTGGSKILFKDYELCARNVDSSTFQRTS